MKIRKRFISLSLLAPMLLFVVPAFGQEAPSATPAPVVIATVTPTPGEAFLDGVTAGEPTSAAAGVLLEALDLANVRAQPDTAATQLGTIRSGEVYEVLGRYFEWYQFRYDPSPTGTGWVFGQLVYVTGPVETLPDIDLSAEATLAGDTVSGGGTQTQVAITLTPGGLQTATAQARIQALAPQELGTGGPEFLPTFTYPASLLVAQTEAVEPDAIATPAPEPSSTAGNQGVAPIVPIAGLLALGILGLLLTRLRR